MRGLQGKNVLVTGGASGIGQATAARFPDEGCAVCVLDRSVEARARVAEELPGLAAVNRKIPMGRHAKPEEIGGLCSQWAHE